jgi:hypothetical protein
MAPHRRDTLTPGSRLPVTFAGTHRNWVEPSDEHTVRKARCALDYPDHRPHTESRSFAAPSRALNGLDSGSGKQKQGWAKMNEFRAFITPDHR